MKLRIVMPQISEWLPKSGGRGWASWLIPLAWWGGVLGMLGIVFGLSFLMAMRMEMRGAQVTVPDMTGKQHDEANAMAVPLELTLAVTDQRYDPAFSSGQIIAQDPPAGTEVKRGRKIKLIVSLGGEVLTVPTIVGKASRAIGMELQQEGFVPGMEVRVPSRSAGEGVVLAQIPPGGSAAVPNTRVYRLVSDGAAPAVFVMPDIQGYPRGPVEEWLRKAGFRLTVRKIRMAGRMPGSIVGQLPLAGYPLREKGVVELTVAD